jgi:hypothetical protein
MLGPQRPNRRREWVGTLKEAPVVSRAVKLSAISLLNIVSVIVNR